MDGDHITFCLFGFGNETNKWENNAADHNEYYGDDSGLSENFQGCTTCHTLGTGNGIGNSTRATFNSAIKVPNNSMSGFCSSCHARFHSAGDGATNGATTWGDYNDNGVSGAFLRHPSDYVIPSSGDYNYYGTYSTSAPVARPDITGYTGGGDTNVTPGTDMVMCLSCHVAHGSDQDYLLRFDYSAMTAGNYADEGTAQAIGGCLNCHSSKGVQPDQRTR